MLLATTGILTAAVIAFKRSWAAPLPFALAGAATLLSVAALAGWFGTPRPQTIHRNLDRRLRLPDLALSSGELEGDGTWLRPLHAQTLARIGSPNWAEVWPVPWPKGTRRSAAGCLACVALLAYFYHTDLQARQETLALASVKDARTVALEAVFKDWEEAKAKDEELKKLLEKLAPLQEKLLAPGASDKQRFADLNRLEEIVASEKAKLDAKSLEPQAAALADAFSSMEGMSAMAAALRKKDFGKAAEQAGEAGEKLSAEKAAVPQGAQEAGSSAGKLSEQLSKSGQQQASQALGQFSEGAKQGDTRKMASGMKGLAQSFNQQSQRNEARKRLSTQLAQLSLCKNPGNQACNGSGMSLMPSLCFSKQPGKGIGSESDPNRVKEATNLEGERRAETMNNVVTDGESEKVTLKSASGQTEAARATQTVSFEAYRKLSQQAIADEAIPAAHRQAIRKYFENIRPTTQE